DRDATADHPHHHVRRLERGRRTRFDLRARLRDAAHYAARGLRGGTEQITGELLRGELRREHLQPRRVTRGLALLALLLLEQRELAAQLRRHALRARVTLRARLIERLTEQLIDADDRLPCSTRDAVLCAHRGLEHR